MSEQLISDLKNAIGSSSRKPLIICGAGVSVSASNGRAPSWAALLESGIAKIESLDPEEGDWGTYARSRLKRNKASEWVKVADEITERLGGSRNAEFAEWIEAQVGHLVIESRILLNAVRDLGCPVATTNYDDILTIGLGVPAITWDDPDQAHRFLLGNLDGILHLHGHWRKPGTVVLGSASYDALIEDRKRKVLAEFAALQSSAVYVGCSADGLSDPDFTHLAAFVTEWQQTMPRSYWLVSNDRYAGSRAAIAASNPRLFPVAFGADHDVLPIFVSGLAPPRPVDQTPTSNFISIEQQEPRPEIFGREAELRDLEDALIAGRSAVIGGGPGFGKTALAVAALYRPKVVERYGDRRVFVSLESQREPRALLAGLAAALGLPSDGEEASLLRQVQLAAAEAPLVAILDNAEHVIEASWSDAQRVLRLAAQILGLSVIVTTRGVVPQVPNAMSIHDLSKLGGQASKEAFLSISGAHFESDEHLGSLLETLDGHALSIELVAARAAGASSLAGIREAWQELRATILRRIGEMEGRLTSVRASLALSLEARLFIKNPLAKRLLAVLAVLPAGLPHVAVSRILADRGGLPKAKAIEAAQVLQQLKLVETRFDNRLRMLTPLREAALLDLNLFRADKRRLIEYYCKVAQRATNIGTSSWEAVREEVEPEIGNFDNVVRIGIDDNPEDNESYLALGGVSAYYRITGQGSWELFEHALSRYEKSGDTVRLGSVHGMIASLALRREELERARAQYEIGLKIAKASHRPLTQANCFAGLGNIEMYFGNYTKAEDYFRKAIDQYAEIGDIRSQANEISAIADLRDKLGDPEAAALYQRAYDLYVEAEDDIGVTNTLRELAEYKRENVEDTLRRSITSYRQLGALVAESSSRTRLAFLLQSAGNSAEALLELDEGSKLARETANVHLEAVALIVRAIILRKSGASTWRTTIADGFDLLRTKLRQEDPSREGYEELETYLTAPDVETRSTARERTLRAWQKGGRVDLARDWLELPIW